MRCTIDHEKVEVIAYDAETVKVDKGVETLTHLLTGHRIIVRNGCEGRVLFVDQTHYEAGSHRAEIWLVHDEVSLAFVRGLLVDSHFFEAEKLLWTIQFERVPGGRHQGEKRIRLSFPPQDIQALVDYIHMKDEIATFNKSINDAFL